MYVELHVFFCMNGKKREKKTLPITFRRYRRRFFFVLLAFAQVAVIIVRTTHVLGVYYTHTHTHTYIILYTRIESVRIDLLLEA